MQSSFISNQVIRSLYSVYVTMER